MSDHQRAGLEIMESIAGHQEAAFEKLYRWTQLECRALKKESPDISGTLLLAMRALADRPVLFSYASTPESTPDYGTDADADADRAWTNSRARVALLWHTPLSMLSPRAAHVAGRNRLSFRLMIP